MAQDFDYIITGAGAAGCVIAARLTEDPAIKVLLIEAGDRDKNFLFHWPAGFAKMTKGIASWGWETVPQKHLGGRKLWYTQAKVLGGGSTINAQIYTRGNALDYDAWETEHGCKGWGYRHLLPYFKRSEGNERHSGTYHNMNGPLGVSDPKSALPVCEAFLKAAQQLGIAFNADFNGEHQQGCGFYQLTQKNARRSSAATAFLNPIKHRTNLEVMTQTETARILVEKQRAIGVEIIKSGQRETIHANAEVIVTSGAIGSPRLLMLSGIGPADHLKSVGIAPLHDLKGVGENLQDHIDVCVICECTGNHSYDRLKSPHRAARAALQYMLFKTGPVVSPLFETGAFWYANKEARSPDIQFHFGQGSGIEKGIAKLDNPGVTLNSANLRPRSRGTVRLASNRLDDAPLIDPNFWADPFDRETSLKGLKIAQEIMRQPALSPFILAERLPDTSDDNALFEYACRMAKTDHHPVGTCKMGIDGQSVVSPDLKVHGIEALRVCDSAIMPLINSSNTNAPTIAIAEKAADMIAGKPPLPAAHLVP